MARLKNNKQYNLGGSLGGIAGMALGQALIPIPGVGAAIGKFAGEMIGSGIQNQFSNQSAPMIYDASAQNTINQYQNRSFAFGGNTTPPTTLYEYYIQRGQQMPSLSERQEMAKQIGIENYTGATIEENNEFLSRLLQLDQQSNTLYQTNNQSDDLQNTQLNQQINNLPLMNTMLPEPMLEQYVNDTKLNKQYDDYGNEVLGTALNFNTSPNNQSIQEDTYKRDENNKLFKQYYDNQNKLITDYNINNEDEIIDMINNHESAEYQNISMPNGTNYKFMKSVDAQGNPIVMVQDVDNNNSWKIANTKLLQNILKEGNLEVQSVKGLTDAYIKNDNDIDGYWKALGVIQKYSNVNDDIDINQNVKQSNNQQLINQFSDEGDMLYDAENEIQAFGGMIKNRKFQNGGELTEYEGNIHEQGGIPLGNTGNEVEGGETRIEDYIFSNRLKYGKRTFADESKRIEKKYERRENDYLAQESKQKELENLMMAQELMRNKLMTDTYNKIYGDNQSRLFWSGGDIPPLTLLSYEDRFVTPLERLLHQNMDVGTNNNNNNVNIKDISSQSNNNQSDITYNLNDNYGKSKSTQFVDKLLRRNNNDTSITMEHTSDNSNNEWYNNLLNTITDKNKLSNIATFAGSQMGNLYDIHRGLKGGSPVNLGRMKPAEFEELDSSRAIQLQQEAGLGANQLYRQQGGQGLGTYLSNIGAQTARTQSGVASTQHAYDEANIGIRNNAALNRQEIDRQNITLAAQEADLRQQEEDIAKNTLQSGLKGLSEGFAVKQLDKNMNAVQNDIINNWVNSQNFITVWDPKSKTPKALYRQYDPETKTTRYFNLHTNDEVDQLGNLINNIDATN